MLKNIIEQHKFEKETYLSREYIPREQIIQAKNLMKNDLAKVIIGPRRTGKSTLAFLMLQEQEFAYINFDDESLLKITDYDEILKALFAVYPDCKTIFFDEIQNLQHWEVFANKLIRRGYNLILTGSNAHLLSSELATSLTGRHIPIQVLPFSFREYLSAKKFSAYENSIALPETKGKLLNFLENFVQTGGFPEIVTKDIDAKQYAGTLLDSILFKDVVKRFKVKHAQKLYDLAIYLLSSFSCEFTLNRLKNILEFNSVDTVQKYLSYLKNAYLFFEIKRFSFKMPEQIKSARKIYLADNSFITAKAFQFTHDTGRLMENTLFVELLQRGYLPDRNIFYYKTSTGKEIDFVIKDGLKVSHLIQSCYEMQSTATSSREMNALLEAAEELHCDSLTIITWDQEMEIKQKRKTISIIPLWKWLLNGNGMIHSSKTHLHS
jgi:predicted AAA+ superfamily ATPase